MKRAEKCSKFSWGRSFFINSESSLKDARLAIAPKFHNC